MAHSLSTTMRQRVHDVQIPASRDPARPHRVRRWLALPRFAVQVSDVMGWAGFVMGISAWLFAQELVMHTHSAWWLITPACVFLCTAAVLLANALAAPDAVQLDGQDSGFNREIMARCPALTRGYTPPLLWGRNGHLQTVLWSTLGRLFPPRLNASRVWVTTHDGALCSVDFVAAAAMPATGEAGSSSAPTPVAVIVPGFTNTAEHRYVRCVAHHLAQSGLNVAVFNPVGCLRSAPLGDSPRLFLYGDPRDLHSVVQQVRARHPDAPLLGIGFSMGGNVLMRYLGESEEHRRVFVAAAFMCSGYDPVDAILGPAPNLSTGFYGNALAAKFRAIVRRHQQHLHGAEVSGGRLDVPRLLRTRSLPEFDTHFTLRVTGHASVQEYYESQRSVHMMSQLHMPLLFLNAADDPLVPHRLFAPARRLAAQRDNVLFALTRWGGHLGFFERHWLPGMVRRTSWLDRVLVEYCAAALTMRAERPAAAKGAAGAGAGGKDAIGADAIGADAARVGERAAELSPA